MPSITDKFRKYYAKDRKTWRKWLERNHTKCSGVWLVYFKKLSGKPSIAYADAVEEALCFGWIDSTQRPGDEEHFIQLFTPRKPRSSWSKLNKERVAKLLIDGLVTTAGLAVIETAKQNGSWTRLDDVESLIPVPELQKAFNKNKPAKNYFESLSKSKQKLVLHWVSNAKRMETRTQRIAITIEALSIKTMPEQLQWKKK